MLEFFEGIYVYSVIVYMTLLTVLFGLVAALNVRAVAGVLSCVGRLS
jgi:hypothetical protein